MLSNEGQGPRRRRKPVVAPNPDEQAPPPSPHRVRTSRGGTRQVRPVATPQTRHQVTTAANRGVKAVRRAQRSAVTEQRNLARFQRKVAKLAPKPTAATTTGAPTTGISNRPFAELSKQVRKQINSAPSTDTAGQRIVAAITGVDPRSAQPGSLANTALTAAAVLAPEAVESARIARAGSTLDREIAAGRGLKTTEGEAITSKLGSSEAKGAEEVASKERAKAGKVKKTARKVKGSAKAASGAARSTGRTLTIPHTVHGANPLAALATVPAASTAGRAVKHEGQALVQEPAKTLATTGRIAEGVPLALLAAGQATGQSIRTGSTKPLEGFVKQQADYAKTVGKFLGGSDKQAVHVAENQLGLLPLVTGALGAKAVHDIAARYRPQSVPVEEAPKLPRKLRKAVETANDPNASNLDRAAAKRAIVENMKETQRSAHKGRKKVARIQGVKEGRTEATLSRELKPGRKEKRLSTILHDLSKRPLGERVTEAHVINLLGREGLYGEDHAFVLSELRKRLSQLREGKRRIDPDQAHTRVVIKAILDHPEILEDPEIAHYIRRHGHVQELRSVESHRELTGRPESTVNPAEERPRLLHLMRAEGIPTAEERLHPELQGKTTLPEKPGKPMDPRLREQARRLKAQGKDAEAEAILSVVNRHKRAENLQIQAHQIEAKRSLGQEVEGDPAALRAEAADLKQKALASDEQRHSAALSAAQKAIESKPYEQPVYFPQFDITRPRSEPADIVPRARGARKQKFRGGSLAETGRVDESPEAVAAGLEHGRNMTEQRRADRQFIDAFAQKQNGQLLIGTQDELAQLRQEGKLDPNGTRVATQDFSAAFQHSEPLRRQLEEARQRAKANKNVKGEDAKLYMWSRSKAAWTEHQAQLQKNGIALKSLRVVGRLQADAMIGTSPAWFVFQIPATPALLVARNPNPIAWARAVRHMIAAKRELSSKEWAATTSLFGGNPADPFALAENRRPISSTNTQRMSLGMKVALKTPFGRQLLEIARKGGPMIAINRAYENQVRTLGAFMEMDRMAGTDVAGNPRLAAKVNRFAQSTAKMTVLSYKHMEQMQGLSKGQQLRYYESHPQELEQFQNAVNDSLMDFSSFSSKERVLASVTPFYSFVRGSLRWLLYAFPKNNPIKAAILYNLAQSNDVALTKLLKGTPDFLQTFGTVVTYDKNGNPQMSGLNVGRSSPGGNSVIEALGSGKIDLATLTQFTWPAIGGSVLALAHQSSTGTTAEGVSTGDLLLRNLASVSPLTRQLSSKIGPSPSFTSQLFRAIEGTQPSLTRNLTPKLTTNLTRERDAVKLSRLLNVAYGSGPTSFDDVKGLPISEQKAGMKTLKAKQKAWDGIDKLAHKYGVSSKAQDKARLKTYERRSSHAISSYGLFGTDTPQAKGPPSIFGSTGGKSIFGKTGGKSIFGSTGGKSIFSP